MQTEIKSKTGRVNENSVYSEINTQKKEKDEKEAQNPDNKS